MVNTVLISKTPTNVSLLCLIIFLPYSQGIVVGAVLVLKLTDKSAGVYFDESRVGIICKNRTVGELRDTCRHSVMKLVNFLILMNN